MEVIDGLMPTNIPFFKERADKIRAKSPLETASLNIVLQEAAVNAAAKATLVAKEAEEQAAAAHEYGSTPRAQLNFDNVNMTPADERTAGTPVVDIKKAEEEESQAKLMAARELAKAAIRAADAAKVVMDNEVEERATGHGQWQGSMYGRVDLPDVASNANFPLREQAEAIFASADKEEDGRLRLDGYRSILNRPEFAEIPRWAASTSVGSDAHESVTLQEFLLEVKRTYILDPQAAEGILRMYAASQNEQPLPPRISDGQSRSSSSCMQGQGEYYDPLAEQTYSDPIALEWLGGGQRAEAAAAAEGIRLPTFNLPNWTAPEWVPSHLQAATTHSSSGNISREALKEELLAQYHASLQREKELKAVVDRAMEEAIAVLDECTVAPTHDQRPQHEHGGAEQQRQYQFV